MYTLDSRHTKKVVISMLRKKNQQRKKNVAVYKAFKKCIVRWEGVVGWRCRAMYTKHFFPASLSASHSTPFIFHFEYNTSFLFSTSTFFLFYFYFSHILILSCDWHRGGENTHDESRRRRKLRGKKMSKWEKKC